MTLIEINGKKYNVEDEFYRTMDTLDRKTLLEMIENYTTIEQKIEWIKQWKEGE